ncbi:hypothetical protein [Exiguobacterium sp. s130]|uniref:hypothetical protein n=1 Tax=Exiguobacterium sp. s130 TaxID=2751190 RepID=UPI001BE7993C|nr:hypothetical protein [Exiguobacterium sp. s130]
MKKYKVVLFILLIPAVPLLVSYLMESSFMDIGSQKAESWMGFWGGYLGAILGIIGAMIAASLQIKSQTNQIVLAAEKNDELERNRIYTNMQIEKNVGIHKEFIELKRVMLNYKSYIDELVEKQRSELVATEYYHSEISKVLQISKENGQEDLSTEQRDYLKMHQNLTDEKKETIEKIKRTILLDLLTISSLTSSISSNSIFFIKNHAYTKGMNELIDVIKTEVEVSNEYLITSILIKNHDTAVAFQSKRNIFFDSVYMEKLKVIENSYPEYSKQLIDDLFTN